MSEFLLIVPDGWTRLDWNFISNHVHGLDYSSVTSYINGNQMFAIDDLLKMNSLIPIESTVTDAKLIDGSYFLVKLG